MKIRRENQAKVPRRLRRPSKILDLTSTVLESAGKPSRCLGNLYITGGGKCIFKRIPPASVRMMGLTGTRLAAGEPLEWTRQERVEARPGAG